MLPLCMQRDPIAASGGWMGIQTMTKLRVIAYSRGALNGNIIYIHYMPDIFNFESMFDYRSTPYDGKP